MQQKQDIKIRIRQSWFCEKLASFEKKAGLPLDAWLANFSEAQLVAATL